MPDKRKIGISLLFCFVSLTMWAGTGRPSDGFLSFILLFGFLILLLGILQLATYIKRKIRELLEDIY
jgi:hypothetical protein